MAASAWHQRRSVAYESKISHVAAKRAKGNKAAACGMKSNGMAKSSVTARHRRQ